MDNTDVYVRLNTLNGRNRHSMLRKDYETLRDFILEILQQRQQISLMELIELANDKFGKEFSCEVALSLVNTKNDLEAQGLIDITYERDRTQLISLKRNKKKLKLSGAHLSANRDLLNADDRVMKLRKWQVNC